MTKTTNKPKNKISVKKLVLGGLFIALGVILPFAFHGFPDGGRVFSPMHIPVFISGILLGGPIGLLVGIITPLLSSLFTGMPPFPVVAIPMAIELCAYGLFAGLISNYLEKFSFAKIVKYYIALIVAQLFGRIIAGFVSAVFLSAGTGFVFKAFLTSYFISALPGIILQLAVIPIICLGITKALKSAKMTID